jgi:signal transduction histidine kinase/CheY-like chemotaxis protein
MPHQRPDRSVVILAAGFLLLILVIGSSIVLSIRQRETAGLVQHTLRVENQISSLLSRAQDAETGQRGYLLTGSRPFLEPFRRSVAAIPAELAALKSAVADNPAQAANVVKLERELGPRLALLQIGIDNFRPGRRVDVRKLSEGKAHMDDIRGIVAAMKREEQTLLAKRSATADRQALYSRIVLFASLAALGLLGAFAVLAQRRRVAEIMSGSQELIRINEKLKEEAASRERAEAQTRQLQKMEAVGQLTGGIAHDFNNMLAIVLGSLDMARRRLPEDIDDRVNQSLANATEGAQRAAQLTSRLLAFSRQQPLEPQTLDANKLVASMSELLRRTIGEQVRVETVLAGGLWPTFADPHQLENAILNLCVNARDAMPDGGKLTIESSNAHLDDAYATAHEEVTAGQYVMISISDTGTGMPPEVMARAFDPFYTTKGVGKGTGLGLSQVFGFVKQSRGHVKIYSEPGNGTTVKVYLPRDFGHAVAVPTATGASDADALPRANPEEIILVAEDDERLRHVTVDSLRELGYTVVQAADANQALAVLAVQPRVDLLFTDIVMPGMNGRQLAELATESRPGLKVVYTTGYTRNAIVHNGMLDPGVNFLAKPFTLGQLASKVRSALDTE